MATVLPPQNFLGHRNWTPAPPPKKKIQTTLIKLSVGNSINTPFLALIPSDFRGRTIKKKNLIRSPTFIYSLYFTLIHNWKWETVLATPRPTKVRFQSLCLSLSPRKLRLSSERTRLSPRQRRPPWPLMKSPLAPCSMRLVYLYIYIYIAIPTITYCLTIKSVLHAACPYSFALYSSF